MRAGGLVALPRTVRAVQAEYARTAFAAAASRWAYVTDDFVCLARGIAGDLVDFLGRG